MNKTFYTWQARTSIGNISVPQLGGSLHLDGRDAKIHITDMDIGGINLVYSSAEVFTWQRSGSRVVLILYGGLGETHEFAVPSNLGNLNLANNDFVKQQQKQGSTIVQWLVQEERTILSFGDCLDVHLVWRNDAYNYWVIDLPAPGPLSLYTSPSRLNSSDRDSSSIIIKAGYLMRSASISGEKLKLVGDVNVTTDIEVISVPPGCCELVSFNGHDINVTRLDGRLQGTVTLGQPHIKIPDLASLSWRYLDTLPELEADYDDFTWTVCDHNSTTNPRSLTTPTSLYAGDYGYHGGSLLYRGHFVATGKEATFRIQTQGGNASAHSIWLNSTFLSSSVGSPAKASYEEHIDLPEPLERGSSYVFTVLIDHMGLSQNFDTNGDEMKTPRGILDYRLSAKNNETTSIQWKLTGNLGGEKYFDHSRGPLNEGALFAERQGYHLPDTPVDSWRKRSPLEGIQKAGVGFFATTFSLDMPEGYDIPLNIVLTGSKAVVANFRVQLFVNGWQYGKYGK
jgi:beta-galactosidase